MESSDFVKEKAEIEPALANLCLGIEHIGSTSVTGLSSKPIIDIDVVIKDYSVFPEVIKKLNSIGYIHEGDLGIKDREAIKEYSKIKEEAAKLYPDSIEKYMEYKSPCIAKLYTLCGLG